MDYIDSELDYLIKIFRHFYRILVFKCIKGDILLVLLKKKKHFSFKKSKQIQTYKLTFWKDTLFHLYCVEIIPFRIYLQFALVSSSSFSFLLPLYFSKGRWLQKKKKKKMSVEYLTDWIILISSLCCRNFRRLLHSIPVMKQSFKYKARSEASRLRLHKNDA